MRVNKLARILVEITSVIVTFVRFTGSGIVLSVRPRWFRPRCPICGKIRPGYDRSKKPTSWVHLTLATFPIVLEYTPRRTDCPTCGVLVERVPWARHNSRFTRPFEEKVAYLAQITNKTAVSNLMGISWRTVGNIVNRVVKDNLDPNRLDGLRNIGVDEFSYRKHHRYITVVVDHDRRRVVWAKKGKTSETLDEFFSELGAQRTALLEAVTIDMSAAYIKSITDKAPNATIVFDRFHVQKLASEALDEVRCGMVNQLKELDDPEEAKSIKKTKYVLLKNFWNLTIKQWGKLHEVQRHNAPLYRAYLLKETLAAVFDETDYDDAKRELSRWLAWAVRSKLKPFIKLAKTIKKYREGILAFFKTRLTNGRAEGINNKLRTIARRAFGFHSAEALCAMLFLCCGGIVLNPPLPKHWCNF
jgi:transposase